MIIFVKLLLAHLLGDFLLQPDAWVVAKEKQKQRSIYFYLHTALHGLLAWLLVFELEFGWYAFALAVTHGGIDFLKLQFQKKKTKRQWFLFDQLLHALVLVEITLMYTHGKIDFENLDSRLWILITAVILLTKPTSIIIKNSISVWTPEKNDQSDDSLQNAGNYIGMLERLFVFGFILTGHFEAIGFLLAAKSIFRFGDLKEAKDRKLTEYVLIGTLLSFGIALLTGLLTQHFLIGIL